eukprot:3247369-Prymnesium_polylepis.1
MRRSSAQTMHHREHMSKRHSAMNPHSTPFRFPCALATGALPRSHDVWAISASAKRRRRGQYTRAGIDRVSRRRNTVSEWAGGGSWGAHSV